MLNDVCLQGRLTAAPELKTTQNGIAFCSFSVACERNYAKDNGERETDFFNVTAWRGTAEFVTRYFGKGDLILIRGALQQRRWQDDQGKNRSVVDVVAEQVNFCGSKNQAQQGQAPAVPVPAPAVPTPNGNYTWNQPQQAAPAQQETFGGFQNDQLPF